MATDTLVPGAATVGDNDGLRPLLPGTARVEVWAMRGPTPTPVPGSDEEV
jgi:hypothetical protein